MAEVLFINDQYIKKYSQINGSVDPNLMYPSIVLAQEKYLMPLLGSVLYKKLKDDVENNTLAGDYATLMNEYCRRVLLWATICEVTPHLTYKIDNGTIVQRSSEDSSSIDDSTMNEFVARFKTNYDFYAKQLTMYLCANNGLFPEYNQVVTGETQPLREADVSSLFLFSKGNTYTSTRKTTLPPEYRPLP